MIIKNSNLLNRTFLFSSLLISAIYSNSLDVTSQKNLGINADESRAYEQSSLIDLEKRKHEEGVLNYSEVVYEHLKAYQSMPRSIINGNKATTIKANYDFYTAYSQLQAQQNAITKQETQKAQEEATKPDMRYLQAYCTLPNEVTVERLASYAILSCDFLNYGRGNLAITLTPDFYSLALVATPLHITINNHKFLVSEGVVLNAARTSINIATSVNDYKIKKIVAAGGIALGNSVTAAAQQYLSQYEQSQTKQSGGDSYVTDGVIVSPNATTNTDKPDTVTYLATAGIEFMSKMVEIVGNSYLDSIPYTFKINQHTLLFADLQADFNTNGIRGVNFAPDNFVQTDEPRMQSDGTYDTGENRSMAKTIPLTEKKQGIQSQKQFKPQYQTNDTPFIMPYKMPANNNFNNRIQQK